MSANTPLDPYSDPGPYEVLGLSPDAKAADIRNRHSELQRQVQEGGGSVSVRSKRKQELEAAYNRLRVAGQRLRVDFFLLDPAIGTKECQIIAKSLATPTTNLSGVVKPRTVRVTHEVLLDSLGSFVSAPPKVEGFHPRAIKLDDEQIGLPVALEIQFDC